MGLQLPPELISLLGMLGYEWPESNEESIFTLAGEWTGMADQLSGKIEALDVAARKVLDGNKGADIDAFNASWSDPEGGVRNLADAADPSQTVNIGLTVSAGLILALKIQVIVQLAILAVQIAWAIATAAVTFGASMLQVPIFKTITGLIIDQLMTQATNLVLNGK